MKKQKVRNVSELSLILCCPTCRFPAAFAAVIDDTHPGEITEAYPVCLDCGRKGIEEFNESPMVDLSAVYLGKPN